MHFGATVEANLHWPWGRADKIGPWGPILAFPFLLQHEESKALASAVGVGWQGRHMVKTGKRNGHTIMWSIQSGPVRVALGKGAMEAPLQLRL